MRTFVKKHLPWLFEYLKHIKQTIVIKEANRTKKMPFKQQLSIAEKQYYNQFKKKLNWNNLETYTEKMQWEKLYNIYPLKVMLSDKYAVREWITSKIGSEYLIPILGVWNSFDEIDFSQLPESFVLKTNHGTGTNLIVKNKSRLNLNSIKRMFDDWMATDFGYTNLEIHYSKIPRKIIAEQYMESEDGELQDYKFLCFNGEPCYCWVDKGRYSNHTRDVFDLNWVHQPWKQERYANYNGIIPKPKNFDKMIELVTILCSGFPHIRVDLYNINGKIYFGEMTFTNGRGLDRIIPEEYDMILGKLWKASINI